MKNRILLALIVSIGLSSAYSQSINREISIVNFSISNMKFKTVNGTFKEMEGVINFDVADLESSSMDVCISSSSVDTDNKKRDQHLRTEDFFDSEKYPEICFKSTSIKQSENNFIAIGELSMHGVTKSVKIPFSFQDNTFNGSFTINRKDFGVGGNGTFMVGNEVLLT